MSLQATMKLSTSKIDLSCKVSIEQGSATFTSLTVSQHGNLIYVLILHTKSKNNYIFTLNSVLFQVNLEVSSLVEYILACDMWEYTYLQSFSKTISSASSKVLCVGSQLFSCSGD